MPLLFVILGLTLPAISWANQSVCERVLIEAPAAMTSDEVRRDSKQKLEKLAEEFVKLVHGTPEEKAMARPRSFMALDMMKEAKRFLDASGIAYKETFDDNQPALLIYPGEKGRLPEFAKRIQAAYNAELLFSPYNSLNLNFVGMAGVRRERGVLIPVLAMGAAWLVSDVRPLRHYGFLHELRHIKFSADLMKRIGNLFDGEAQAGHGFSLPEDTGLDFPIYGDGISFEEMPAFQTSIYVLASQILGALNRGATVESLAAKLRLLNRVGLQSVVNNRRIRMAFEAAVTQHALGLDKEHFEDMSPNRRVYAIFKTMNQGVPVSLKVGVQELLPPLNWPTNPLPTPEEIYAVAYPKMLKMLSVARKFDEQSASLRSDYEALGVMTQKEELLKIVRQIQSGQKLIRN